MTDRHPLHPKLIDALSEYRTCDEAMRAAADWQLERVIEWLSHNLDLEQRGVDYIVGNLREAMRPTTTQETPND